MSSSASSGISYGVRRIGAEKGGGIPRECRCGVRSKILTTEKTKNPGRLFYCCPYDSKEDNRHLFKWTDVAMVEEMEDVKSVVEKIKVDIGSLEKGFQNMEAEMETPAMETRTCEAVTNSYGNEIQVISSIAKGCEKEIGELKAMVACCEKEIQSLRCFKNLVVCSLVMVVAYVFMF